MRQSLALFCNSVLLSYFRRRAVQRSVKRHQLTASPRPTSLWVQENIMCGSTTATSSLKPLWTSPLVRGPSDSSALPTGKDEEGGTMVSKGCLWLAEQRGDVRVHGHSLSDGRPGSAQAHQHRFSDVAALSGVLRWWTAAPGADRDAADRESHRGPQKRQGQRAPRRAA